MDFNRHIEINIENNMGIGMDIFPQLGLPIRGSYCVPKQWVSCAGLRAPRVPGMRPARVPGMRPPPGSLGLQSLVPRPKVKSQKCQKNPKCQKHHKKKRAAREVKCKAMQSNDFGFFADFGLGNQAREARGTRPPRILGEPGARTPRHSPPVALVNS